MLYVAQTWGQDTHSIIGMGIGDCTQDIVVRAHTEARIIYEPAPDPACQGAWYQAGCVVLALPLLVNERSTGVITLQDPQPAVSLSRSQHDLARGIANQTAIALENARLYARIRRFNNALEQLVAERTHELLAEKDRLRTLYEITKEVGSTLDLDALLNMSLTALARITCAEFGSVMLVEQDTDHLVSRASLGNTESVFTRFPIGVGIAGWVAEHKEPVLIPDVKADPRWMALPSDEHRGKRKGSMVAVPLMAQNEVLGVLTLSHQQTGYFNEDHLRLMNASAGALRSVSTMRISIIRLWPRQSAGVNSCASSKKRPASYRLSYKVCQTACWCVIPTGVSFPRMRPLVAFCNAVLRNWYSGICTTYYHVTWLTMQPKCL